MFGAKICNLRYLRKIWERYSIVRSCTRARSCACVWTRTRVQVAEQQASTLKDGVARDATVVLINPTPDLLSTHPPTHDLPTPNSPALGTILTGWHWRRHGISITPTHLNRTPELGVVEPWACPPLITHISPNPSTFQPLKLTPAHKDTHTQAWIHTNSVPYH